jgi:YfiH family protein
MTFGSSLLAAIPGLRHAFFTREGGVSGEIYESLNGGLGSNDDPANVLENRRRMAEQMGVEPENFISVHQVHSPDAVVATGPWPSDTRPRADAIVTRTEGIAIGVTAADCGPILLADAGARVIGAAHAGWKGAFAGVVEATVAAMEERGARRERIAAAIGPVIARKSYEVDEAFLRRFLAAEPEHEHFFTPGREGHHQFDIEAFVLAKVAAAGVRHAEALGLDTYAEPDRFYSYRRATHRGEPTYGRQFSIIALP